MNWKPLSITLPAPRLREVKLRLAEPSEYPAVDAALAAEHYLGSVAGRQRGIVQLAVLDEQVVAILIWTVAARKLAAREAWIGWDGRTRARRLPLLVQNNRFLVLSQVRQPNLASRVLGLAVAALPGQWAQQYGVIPLLAESFVDPERYAGTCYKAAGWIEIGRTAGFARQGHDYYVEHGQAKCLWLRELAPDARQRLRDPLGEEAGTKARAFGQLPVPMPVAESLAQALRTIPDPRRAAGRQFPLNAILTGAVLALASGARTVSDLFRFVQELTPAQRRALGFRGMPRNQRIVPPPGEGCWRKVLSTVQPQALTTAIVQWQLSQRSLPPLLAIDGKTLHRGLATLVTLCDAQTGEPIAQLAQSGPGHEKRLAHTLVESMPVGSLDNKLVGGDALYADAALVRKLVQDHGAITAVQLKDNQAKAAQRAEVLLQHAPLFSKPPSSPSTGASTNDATVSST